MDRLVLRKRLGEALVQTALDVGCNRLAGCRRQMPQPTTIARRGIKLQLASDAQPDVTCARHVRQKDDIM
jgi:hypothetical protein